MNSQSAIIHECHGPARCSVHTLPGRAADARPAGSLFRAQADPTAAILNHKWPKTSFVSERCCVNDCKGARFTENAKGVVEPAGFKEVVSDVVVSDAGELDVSFEVPDGGAFRVMDVIVIEAPTLPGTHTH